MLSYQIIHFKIKIAKPVVHTICDYSLTARSSLDPRAHFKRSLCGEHFDKTDKCSTRQNKKSKKFDQFNIFIFAFLNDSIVESE